MATLLFFGLESFAHGKLASILEAEGHCVLHAGTGQPYPCADAVFCDGDDEQYWKIFSGIRASLPGLPLIVVTQNPSEAKWLDAIEAGAADYCSAPFEAIQVRWILEGCLGRESAKPVAAPIRSYAA
jgi:DNA-binding response OmpR family regulator